MKATLEVLLPKLGVTIDRVQILSHQGKSDLEASWRRKLPNWNTLGVSFLILRDADGADCVDRKATLSEVASHCGKTDVCKVRIVCQELEAWFLGDADALRAAGYLKQNQNPKELREPDLLVKPSHILARWKPGRQKVAGAVEIAKHMEPQRNTSPSFRHTMEAIKQLAS